MRQLLDIPGSMLARLDDGEAAFMEFVRSAGRALAQNQAVAPLVGLGILALLILVADWKLAGWIERVWRKRHSRRGPDRHEQAARR